MTQQRTIANALHLAFEKGRDQMTSEQLHWLAECTSFVHEETANLSETLQAFAAVFQSDDVSSMPESSQFAHVLYGLASRLDTLDAMLFISREAEFTLKKRQNNADACERCKS